MISRTDFLRACKRARRDQPEFAYGGMGLGLGLGLSHLQGRAGGVAPPSYPAAVVSAGAQVAWDQRAITGWRVPPTKVIGVDPNPTGWTVTATYIRSSGIGSKLEGWDTNGRNIEVIHSSCEVRDNKVWLAGSRRNGLYISTSQTVDGTIVEYNEFDGKGNTSSLLSATMVVAIAEHGTAAVTNSIVRANYCHHYDGDAMTIRGGGALVELNRVLCGGWGNQGAHYDSIDLWTGNNASPSLVQDNFLDMTPDPDPNGTMGRTSCGTYFNCPNGVTIRRNIIGVGAREYDNGWNGSIYGPPQRRAEVMYFAGSTNANLDVINNVFEYYFEGGAGPWYTTRKGIRSWSDNYRMTDNALINYIGNN